MASKRHPSQEPFEFRATLTRLDAGLDSLHQSIEGMRKKIGRAADDRDVMHFETAIAEIGANVLTHGRPAGSDHDVDYLLRFEHGVAVATFSDPGPPFEDQPGRVMPDASSERGRGLVLARSLLDELAYERDGDVNRWRLVKRL